MQIGKILFLINVNLCFQYDGWPSGMEMPPTSMYGDHHARWGKILKYLKKHWNFFFDQIFVAGPPWTPWRQLTTRRQPSTWIIHPGRTPHPDWCDKVAIPWKQIWKKPVVVQPGPAVPGAWFGHWRVFCATRPWRKNASISEVYQRNKSEKLASINLSFKFSSGCRLSLFEKRIFRLYVCSELR